MLCFAIALRGPKSTDNWPGVLADFRRTLHSVFNQTNPDFRVYVGCSGIPELDESYDDRLRWVTADLPVPKTWEEKCRDRSWKLCLCAQQIRKDLPELAVRGGGTFVFPVDADDLVSCRLAEYAAAHPEANGFKSPTGYRWIRGSSRLEITPYYGGTMNIMKLYEEDLPETLPDPSLCFDEATAMALTARWPIRWYDCEVEGKFAALGRPLTPLPFRSTIYVLGTGENISGEDPHAQGEQDRFHPVAFLRSLNPFTHRRLSDTIKREFGMV